jgi:hypothetical protein
VLCHVLQDLGASGLFCATRLIFLYLPLFTARLISSMSHKSLLASIGFSQTVSHATICVNTP